MNKLILTVIISLLTTSIAKPITLYNTIYNHFHRINLNSKATISDKYLQLSNTSERSIVVTDSTSIDAFANYKFYMRFANLHNQEGKSYKIIDNQGATKSISSTECGLVFNYIEGNFWMVTASCDNSSLYNESVDTRSITIKLIKVVNGKRHVIKQTTLDKGVDLYEDYNYLGVTINGKEVTVKAGKNELKDVLSHNLSETETPESTFGFPSVKVGYFVGPGALISIERTVLSFNAPKQSSQVNLETHWTREALDRHFANSKNPYEGYWTYLDRDMEDKWLKIGGRYTIALVETGTGYDVIYVDGAQVKKSQWHIGMRKGEMIKTIFTDNFTGKWYDATQEIIDQDIYVTFESGVILTFKFPVYKSQVRFSKILQ